MNPTHKKRMINLSVVPIFTLTLILTIFHSSIALEVCEEGISKSTICLRGTTKESAVTKVRALEETNVKAKDSFSRG